MLSLIKGELHCIEGVTKFPITSELVESCKSSNKYRNDLGQKQRLAEEETKIKNELKIKERPAEKIEKWRKLKQI